MIRSSALPHVLGQPVESAGVEPKYWVPLAGRDNEITVKRSYESLDEWTRVNEAWHTDNEVMSVARHPIDLVQPGTSQTIRLFAFVSSAN